MSAIRTPAVAGLFNPADPRQLAHGAQEMLLASALWLGALAVFIHIVLVAIKHNPLPFFHSAPDITRESANKEAW